jgi:putative FmdB family regulatory protein
MPAYLYRCDGCGPFEVRLPFGTAGSSASCRGCGATATRVYAAPLLNRTPRPVAEALSKAERSAEQPEVVRSVPPARGSSRPRRPALLPPGLPRW